MMAGVAPVGEAGAAVKNAAGAEAGTGERANTSRAMAALLVFDVLAWAAILVALVCMRLWESF